MTNNIERNEMIPSEEPFDIRKKTDPIPDDIHITIKMTPDLVLMMFDYLAQSISSKENDIFQKEKGKKKKEKESSLSPIRQAFGPVVKGFSPELQKALLGETPGAYWLSPEIEAGIRSYYHRKNEGIPEEPLPGEVISETREIMEMTVQSPVTDSTPSKTQKNDYLLIDEKAPELYNPVHRSMITTNPSFYASSIPSSNTSHISQLTTVKGEPFSETEQRFHDEGFRFGDQSLNRLLIRAVGEYSDAPVLLVGPSGVGKSRLAQVMHDCYWKNRDKKRCQDSKQHQSHPFIEVNCAHLESQLADSAIFGHVPGAFTGADKRVSKKGYFEQANGGTLFLDEFETLPLEMQAKLLTSFDLAYPMKHQFTPLGSDKKQISKFRLFVATNVDPFLLLREKRLREDFFSRLGGCTLSLPTLAQNRTQIEILFKQTLDSMIQARNKENQNLPFTINFTKAAEKMLSEWFLSPKNAWTYNRRDLVNCVNELMLLGEVKNGKMMIDTSDIESLKKRMRQFWHNVDLANHTLALPQEAKTEKISFHCDPSSIIKICCGEGFLQKITPNKIVECFDLIMVNICGGSALKAGKMYYGKSYTNPSKKMCEQLKKVGLLENNEEYKTMLDRFQQNFFGAITDSKFFQKCPSKEIPKDTLGN